jgi:16S rRNA processing protein RimM
VKANKSRLMLSNPDSMTGIKKQNAADFTLDGEPAYLIVGKVRRPHGVRGEVVVEISTDFPDSLMPKKVIYVGEKHKALVVTSLRPHNEGLLLGFEGISTPEQAGRYRNAILSISKSETHTLPEGEFYSYELLGLIVVDEAGNQIGNLSEIIQTGANDVYVVKDNFGKSLLLPAIPEVVLNVNLVNGTIRVHILTGLTWE